MLTHLKQHWRTFKQGKPGSRFQERYHRRRRVGDNRLHKALISIASGLTTTCIGIVLLVTPGPGWAIIFIGASMIAGESLTMSRFLDRLEVGLRRLVRRLKNSWQRSPQTLLIPTALGALLTMAAFGYLTYLVIL